MYIIIFVINVALEHKITHIPQYYRSNSCASKSARVLLLLRRRRPGLQRGFPGAGCRSPAFGLGTGFPARARGTPNPRSSRAFGTSSGTRHSPESWDGGDAWWLFLSPRVSPEARVGLNKAFRDPETPPPGPVVGTRAAGENRADLYLVGLAAGQATGVREGPRRALGALRGSEGGISEGARVRSSAEGEHNE